MSERTATGHDSLLAVRRLADAARLAPSVHNTQPWHFELTPTTLTLLLDRSRQLRVLDPTGRQLFVSLGCALMNARISAVAQLIGARVERLPDGDEPGVVARVTLTGDAPSEQEMALAPLAPVLRARATNRRRFSDEPVPDELIDTLCADAAAEGARLVRIHDENDRVAVARLSQRADALQNENPAYRAEVRAWTTDDPSRLDGVPSRAVPHVDAGSGDEIPIRDFDSTGAGWLPTDTRSSHNQCLLLLGADSDNPLAWLRVGEALQRIWLQITRNGFVMSPLTQVVEVPSARAALREELRLTMQPDVLMRVGRAMPTAGTSRRHLDDLLFGAPNA